MRTEALSKSLFYVFALAALITPCFALSPPTTVDGLHLAGTRGGGLPLHYMHYNFCRIHKTLRVTPAMAAGVTDRVWSMDDVAALIAAQEPATAKRGPYKKRAA
jgi:hypothetical protein